MFVCEPSDFNVQSVNPVTVHHYTAFSSQPGMGNPAGVVFGADALSDAQMQRVAHAVAFNETTFVQSSRVADLRLRYFTPGYEMDLCGHGTVATLYALSMRGAFDGCGLPVPVSLAVETAAAILPMRISVTAGRPTVHMSQTLARFEPCTAPSAEIAALLGITPDDLDPALPIMYGSTGVWTLLIPVRSLAAMRRMTPATERVPAVLRDRPRVSLHPFCLETIDPAAQMHGRHFSSPYAGTVEDPVTGTACGVMGAYYAEVITHADHLSVVVEQGQEVGRDGRVQVEVTRGARGIEVEIAGTAAYVEQFRV